MQHTILADDRITIDYRTKRMVRMQTFCKCFFIQFNAEPASYFIFLRRKYIEMSKTESHFDLHSNNPFYEAV